MLELEDFKNTPGLDSRWFTGESKEDKQKFEEQLKSQTLIWAKLIKILKEMYRSADVREYNFETPNMHERMLFNEGYKKALIDVFKLLPTQRGDQPK